MTTTIEDMQKFIQMIGAKIQSMRDVSYDRISEFGKCAAKLADLPLSNAEIKDMILEYTIRRDVEAECCEKLQELAKMCNEFFAK